MNVFTACDKISLTLSVSGTLRPAHLVDPARHCLHTSIQAVYLQEPSAWHILLRINAWQQGICLFNGGVEYQHKGSTVISWSHPEDSHDYE